MVFFREFVFCSRNIGVFGLKHGSTSDHAIKCLERISLTRPSRFLVECGHKSLSLSRFVWETRRSDTSPEMFCVQESEHNETFAIAAAHKLGLPLDNIKPIDINPLKTRFSLVKSAVLHPWESLILISRFHGKVNYQMSLEEIGLWRSEFKRSCPYAYKILFTDRENHMVNQIIENSRSNESVTVIVGISHLDAIYERLLDEASRESYPS